MKMNRFFALLLVFFLTGCGTFQVGVEQTPDATQVMQALLTAQARLTEIAAQPTATPVPPTATAAQTPSATANPPSAPAPLTATAAQTPSATANPPSAPAPLTATAAQTPSATANPPTAPAPPTAAATSAPLPTEPQSAPQATAGPMMVKVFLIAVGDEGVSGKKIGCGDSAVPVEVQIQHTQAVLKAALQSLLAIKQQSYGQSGLYNSLYQSDLQVDSVKIENGKATINLSGSMSLGGECDNPRVQAQLEETARQFSTVSDVAIFVNGKPLADVLSLK